MGDTANDKFCVAPNCPNLRERCPDLSFFRFPEEALRGRTWMTNCGLGDTAESAESLRDSGAVLCAHHFEESQFKDAVSKSELIPDAVPTLFDNLSPHSEDQKGSSEEQPLMNPQASPAIPEECSQPSLALPENPAHQLGGSNTTPMAMDTADTPSASEGPSLEENREQTTENPISDGASSFLALRTCPAPCPANCEVNHHPLLLAMLNLNPTQLDLMKSLALSFVQEGWSLDLPIPDPVEAYALPLTHWAAIRGSLAILEWLLSEGVPSCDSYMSPLHSAFNYLHQFNFPGDLADNFMEVFPLLKECLCLADANGITPLYLCSSLVIPRQNGPPLDLVLSWINALLDLVEDRETAKAILNQPDSDGNCILHVLMESSAIEVLPVIQRMLDLGAGPVAPNNQGISPLSIAKAKDHPFMAAFEDFLCDAKNALRVMDGKAKTAVSADQNKEENMEIDTSSAESVKSNSDAPPTTDSVSGPHDKATGFSNTDPSPHSPVATTASAPLTVNTDLKSSSKASAPHSGPQNEANDSDDSGPLSPALNIEIDDIPTDTPGLKDSQGPVITIEKDNQMMDLVGEKEILKFLSTLKAPSVTLDKFKDHIEKHRDILDAELIEMNYHIQAVLKGIAVLEKKKRRYTKKRVEMSVTSMAEIIKEEDTLRSQINALNQQITDNDSTLLGLKERLVHCQQSLRVLQGEDENDGDLDLVLGPFQVAVSQNNT